MLARDLVNSVHRLPSFAASKFGASWLINIFLFVYSLITRQGCKSTISFQLVGGLGSLFYWAINMWANQVIRENILIISFRWAVFSYGPLIPY
jgi:hypothetical protein